MNRREYAATIFFIALMLIDGLLFLNVLMLGSGGYINETNVGFAETALKIFPYMLYGFFISFTVESIHAKRKQP